MADRTIFPFCVPSALGAIRAVQLTEDLIEWDGFREPNDRRRYGALEERGYPMDHPLTSELLRQHVNRHVELFRTAADPNLLLTAHSNVTDSVSRNAPIGDFGLKQKLDACAFPKVVGYVRFTQPWSRTPPF